MEAVFEIAYLLFAIGSGIVLLKRADGDARLTGLAALVLGLGDAFHLVPRVMAAFDPARELTAALGIGKLVTSVTMTVFYVLLERYRRRRGGLWGEKPLWIATVCLACVRIALCLLPQNEWLSATPPVLWGLIRNIPFAAMGAMAVVAWLRSARHDKVYRRMWLWILLSFAFYIPVVLFAQVNRMVGMLMLPKTVMYVIMLVLFHRAANEGRR